MTLVPVADTTLIESAPNNSNGGERWVNSGTTQNGPNNRGLYRFDLTSLPTNAIIQSATLVLEVTRRPSDGYASGYFGLHRMFRPWGEGVNIATNNSGGLGAPAWPGDATWLCSYYPTNFWSAPGGAAGMDFSSEESSSQRIEGSDTYTFPSTFELVDDVQTWVRNPASNFGWMLICSDEGLRFTSRRFNSREDPNAAPQLEITYFIPILPLVIVSAQKLGNEFTLTFMAQPDRFYTVEYCDKLGSNIWQPLAYVWTPDKAKLFTVTDTTIVSQRFYRLMTTP